MTAELHPAVRDLLDQLGTTAPEAVADAEAALGWMVGDRDLGAITQFGLQQFLWYELPFKWMVEPPVRLEIAANLATFLDAAGYPRYAALARSEQTRTVMAAWAVDPDAGYEAFKESMGASGVEPPDLPELGWGVVMGRAEHDAFWSTAAALEIAGATGDLPTTSRKAAAARVEVARTHLTMPRPDLGGESLLGAVHRERIEAWARLERGGARAQLLDPVLNQVIAPVRSSEPLTASLAPLHALLEAVGADGLELTPAGYLPRLLVVDIDDRFGDRHPDVAEPRSEVDCPFVAILHDLARARRLVRRRGKRLVLTARGKEVLTSPEALVDEVVAAFVGEGFQSAAAEVLLASLLGELGRGANDRVAEASVALTEEGWTVRNAPVGAPVPTGIVRDELRRLRDVGDLFGWFADGVLDRVDLTPHGRLAARAALRTIATGPRTAT